MGGKSDTNPDNSALCVMLAGDNHAAGILLFKIVYWARYAVAIIPKKPGKWIARPRGWWAREARLSNGQLDRALALLARYELVEKTQFWFGHESILHIRPSWRTRNFLAAATTWEAAAIILLNQPNLGDAGQNFPQPISDNPGSMNLANFNEFAAAGDQSLSETMNSKYIIQITNSVENNTLTSAHAPSAVCTEPSIEKKNKKAGEKSCAKKISYAKLNKGLKAYTQSSNWGEKEPLTLQQVATAFVTALQEKYPCDPTIPSCADDLPPAAVGTLGVVLNSLVFFDKAGNHDFRWAADNFITYAVTNLPGLMLEMLVEWEIKDPAAQIPKKIDTESIMEWFPQIVTKWIKATFADVDP
jgi:hypothetical protein